MTAVLGLRKVFNGEPFVVVAADSLFALGFTRMRPKNASKLVKFPNFVVGFSGVATIQPLLLQFSQDTSLLNQKFMKMTTSMDALRFGDAVFTEYKARLETSGEANLSTDMGDLIIATPEKLFCVDRFRFVSEHEDFVSTGCADELIAGLLGFTYELVGCPEDLMYLANDVIEKVCEANIGCRPPVRLAVVERYETPPPRSKRKLRYKFKLS